MRTAPYHVGSSTYFEHTICTVSMSPEENTGRTEALDAQFNQQLTGCYRRERPSGEEVVLHWWNAFTRVPRGNPPARVEPLRVTIELFAQAGKAWSRTYPPAKACGHLAACVATLVMLEFSFPRPRAV